MMNRVSAAVVIVVSLALGACSKNSPTGPSGGGGTSYTVSGTVRVAGSGGGTISGATVTVVDGSHAGQSTTTNGSGGYSLTGLSFEGFQIKAAAANFVTLGKSAALSTGVTNSTLDFALLPTQVFSKSGIGDQVFDLPTYVSRVRITGQYNSNSSNFIVHIAGRGVVNELLGTFWGQTSFDGTYVTTGGVVETLSSSGVAWSFTEVR